MDSVKALSSLAQQGEGCCRIDEMIQEGERRRHIDPILFDAQLIDWCEESIQETCGKCLRLQSGPLHDAAEVSLAGIPTSMMFVQSLHGISHNKIGEEFGSA